MANTYSQIYIQIVFIVKGRQNLIPQDHKKELHKFITGVITKRQQKLLAINCMADHVHIFVNIQPSISISNLTRDIKSASSKFIKEKGWVKYRFSWQQGFGAFSYSQSQISRVINYVNNQEEHHRKTTFQAEYMKLLKKYNVDYQEKYLFEFIK